MSEEALFTPSFDGSQADSSSWTMAELVEWEEKIRVYVDAFGLDCFEQEFEVCDHEQMIGFMAYHGMPAHYPHWSLVKVSSSKKHIMTCS